MANTINKPETGAEWSNWSGNQTASPSAILVPADLHALKTLMKTAPGPVRVVGAGHSFTPVAATDGTLLKLDRMGLVHSVDKAKKTAWVNAGARLKDLSPALEAYGLAFRNLGDINVQSLAGAISTATHGTGETLSCLSAEILSFKVLTAAGELVTVSRDENRDLFEACQVSLGAIGILVEAEVQLVDAYRLHRKTSAEPLADLLASAKTRWQTLRNYEFFYVPFSGYGISISHELTDAPASPREESDDDDAVLGLKRARDYAPDDLASRKQFLAGAFAEFEGENVIGNSWELLASERNVPFNEMEYHLPEGAALDVLQEVITYIETERPDVFFPIEVRKSARDDIWLSPFNDGSRISIAVHAYAEDEYDFFFSHIEPIFRRAGGRPHWGKLHSLTHADLTGLYPEFDRFCQVRREVDPDGRFLSPYLKTLFEPGTI
ncbi:D-arabinono-1,4-lactone oxidase [Henriciella litoralis]|uniref:D-arabinono-1,4-lactone oxidase n=1 Tax=Henriciella litoralis TaxID=568102 RepID=UPI00146B511A|nr:D-arabinono-1,4-lactone oxidase [Henriciella litoralis]